ncbi:hypothetical protein GTA09_16940 [Rhodococcus hoagii]|nr:hypothetical protein [Prescottella equi]
MVLVDKGVDLTFVYKVRNDAAVGPRQAGMSMNIYAFVGTQVWNPMTGLNLSVTQPSVATHHYRHRSAVAKVGATVPLTASVNPTDANGTVQFKENGANIGSPVTVTNGWPRSITSSTTREPARSAQVSSGRARTRTRAVQRRMSQSPYPGLTTRTPLRS